MRNIPIFTFVNKMDRAAKDPFALMEELEQVLGIRSCPINWPIGTDGDFQGVYHRDTKMVELYTGGDHGKSMVQKTDIAIDDPALEHVLAKHYRERLAEEIDLLDEAGDAFDLDKVRRGELTPMVFGSVLQFEVLEHRLKTEYQVDIVMESMPFRFVRWVVSTPKPIDQLKLTSTSGRAKDSRDRDVLLFENEWSIRLACENNAGLELAETANRK